ncbi:MAG TPA: hypothetical protein VK179_16980 [Bacteroidales bacterium]|nr:hypothetical protein [Bacteroidales bacterium]
MLKSSAIFFLLFVTHLVFAQRELSDKQWTEDLDYIIHRIDSVHPGLCKNDYRNVIYEKSTKLKEKIPLLSDNEILIEIFKIIAVINDGHTRLHGKNLTKKWYPLRIEKFDDGYFITVTSIELSEYIGAEVITMNSQPIGLVFEKITGISPGDNINGKEYFVPMFMTMTSVLSGLHITGSENDTLMIALKKDNIVQKLSVLPVEFESGQDLSWFWKDYGVPAANYSNILQSDSLLPDYLKNYNKPYWFKLNGKTIYFAFNSCENDEREEFHAFNTRLWKTIDSADADCLVIDLRNNFGGTNSILNPLLHEIIKHDKINQAGHLFLVTGKKTFSAAVDFTAWIEFHCNPIIVGEAAGAGPNHFADPDFSILPNSNNFLLVSKYFWQDSWPWDNRIYIEPSIKIGLSSVDYFSFSDPVVTRIKEYIRQGR